MQNLTKCSTRQFYLYKSMFSYSRQIGAEFFLEKQDSVLLNNKRVYRNIHPISHRIYKQLNREYKAICSLLLHSNLFTLFNKIVKRTFNTSSTTFSNDSGSSNSDKSSDPKKDKDKDKGNQSMAIILKITIWLLLAYLGISFLIFFSAQNRQDKLFPTFVSWNEFVHDMLAKGEVEELIIKPELDLVTIILYEGAVIRGRKIGRRVCHMFVADAVTLEEKLRQAEDNLGIRYDQRVPIIYERGAESMARLYSALLVIILLLIMLGRAGKAWGSLPSDIFSQMTRAKFTLVDPLTGKGKGVRFDDVAGLKEAKIEVMEFVDYLKNPSRYKSLGAKIPHGALLLGPPGCGKTLLAKAVATEANVPFLSMNGSEFIEMIGGLGAARVRSLFKEGRKRSPSIIYIDEIDAIGKKRSPTVSGFEGASGESEQTLNQLLVEMDGMASTEGVIVLASTNRAEVLDKALLRPGRFDRHILIDLPTLEERRQIFEQHLKGIVLENKPSTYSMKLAYLTPGFSGADIANVCNEAALHAARDKKKIVTGNDLLYAIDRMVGGPEKRDTAMSPAEKRVVAYHEVGHALVGWLLKHTDALLKVTIVPRTNLSLGFAQYIPADRKLYSREELFDRMCMALGGRAAESIMFNSVTDGARNDLTKVTKMAYAQIREYGMNENIGLVSFSQESTDTSSKKPYSKKLGNLIDVEAMRLVAHAYKITEELLQKNKDKLELLAEELLKKETLSNEEMEKLIGPPPFGKKKLIEPADFETSVKVATEPPTQAASA